MPPSGGGKLGGKRLGTESQCLKENVSQSLQCSKSFAEVRKGQLQDNNCGRVFSMHSPLQGQNLTSFHNAKALSLTVKHL